MGLAVFLPLRRASSRAGRTVPTALIGSGSAEMSCRICKHCDLDWPRVDPQGTPYPLEYQDCPMCGRRTTIDWSRPSMSGSVLKAWRFEAWYRRREIERFKSQIGSVDLGDELPEAA